MSVETPWHWRKPSWTRFVRSFWDDPPDFIAERRWQTWHWAWRLLAVLFLVSIPVVIYIYRYALLHPVYLNLRIFAVAILVVGAIAVGAWILIGAGVQRWLPESFSWYLKPVGAVLAAWLVVTGAAAGKDLHGFFSQYWRHLTLNKVEPKQDPLTDHDRIWSVDGIYTFARREMRDTEAPTRPNLVRIGETFHWTMGVEPTTPILQITESIDEVVSIPATITSFELPRGKNAYFDTGETLRFSRNVFTCTRRAFWFWDAFSHEVPNQLIYLKNDAGAWVQVVPIIRWAGWVFPRPEFGGVWVIPEADPNRSWLGERLQTLKRVFLGCGTWIGPEQIASTPYLVGQNIVPLQVSRYMASSIRFRNGFWAPTWWRREGDVRIADMPDDQNEQPFVLFFHVRNNEGKVVASKLFQYVALEPLESAGHAAELLYPADSIGPSYVYQFFGERESLMGVTAVPGWVRSSRRNYDWSTNLPNEHRPYIKDLPDSNGVVKAHRMWLTAVVTIDKKRYEDKDPKGFITGSPEIVITDARYKKSVWVDSEKPSLWTEQVRSALGANWSGATQ